MGPSRYNDELTRIGAPVTMVALPETRPLFIVSLLFQKLDMLSVKILFM